MYLIYYIYYQKQLLYIGSTNNFKRRKRSHKSNCYNQKQKKDYNQNIYKHIRNNNINWGDLEWKVDETDITDVKDAHRLEGFKILEMKPLCNEIIAGRTQREYKQTDKYKEYRKEYKQTDKWKEYMKEYKKTDKWKEKYKEYQKLWFRQYRQKQKLYKDWLISFSSYEI